MLPSQIAGAPPGPITAPAAVHRLALGILTPVWKNSLGGLTFRDDVVSPIGTPKSAPQQFIKWVAAGVPELNLAAEADRLRWARGQGASVPEVIALGSDATGSWLATAPMPGESAVSQRWIEQPEAAARAIGAGLRLFHEQLDPRLCPFGPTTSHMLPGAPPVDRLVVCHGDACAPNTLLASSGGFAGHVDLGELGIGDRWYDLTVAAWSTEWNYGPGYDHFVYKGYGVEADPVRIDYYRRIWDLG